MSWLRVVAECPAPAAERLAEALEELEALSVSLEDAQDTPLYVQADEVAGLWRQTRVQALFPAGTPVEPLWAALAGRLEGALPPDLRLERLEDRDWVAATREAVTARCYGGRLWVGPSWSPPPPEGIARVRIDPGLAFGTGAHATTALCLEWLAQAPLLAGARVLDYGCGSGVLALSALALGAARAWAVDLDPRALQVTGENAQLNALADRVEVCLPEALEVGPFDVVLANILLQPLLDLAPSLAASVRPGGRLALSGLLAGQAQTCLTRYAPWFEFEPVRLLEGWALLSAVRARDPETAP